MNFGSIKHSPRFKILTKYKENKSFFVTQILILSFILISINFKTLVLSIFQYRIEELEFSTMIIHSELDKEQLKYN